MDFSDLFLILWISNFFELCFKKYDISFDIVGTLLEISQYSKYFVQMGFEDILFEFFDKVDVCLQTVCNTEHRKCLPAINVCRNPPHCWA